MKNVVEMDRCHYYKSRTFAIVFTGHLSGWPRFTYASGNAAAERFHGRYCETLQSQSSALDRMQLSRRNSRRSSTTREDLMRTERDDDVRVARERLPRVLLMFDLTTNSIDTT